MRTHHGFIRYFRKQLPRDRSRLSKIYICGVRPAAGCGPMALGMSDQEHNGLRSVLLSGLSPAHRGASLTAKVCFHGDPAWVQATAPARQWST
eukprot:2379206-Pyramimonas_sp.AAC.1